MSNNGGSFAVYLGGATLAACATFYFIKARKQKSQANRFMSDERVLPHREGWLLGSSEESGDYSHPEGPNLGSESHQSWYDQTPQQRATSSIKTDLLHRGHRKGGKLIIVMVGMPGSGKTLIARKVARYLRWISYRTKAFSIAKYRLDKHGSKTSDYFSTQNHSAYSQRLEIITEALEDSIRYLHRGGEIAILDGTNSSVDRRDLIRSRVKKEDGYELFWIESQVDFYTHEEEDVREDFCRNLRKSPDFISLSDFEKRVQHYRSTYAPLSGDEGSYIRIHDNFSTYTLHETQGFLPSKIVSFVVNLKQRFRAVHLCRHGESTFNSRGLIGGDAPLSAKGAKFANALSSYAQTMEADRKPSSAQKNSPKKKELHVWTSCMKRTKETANFLVKENDAKLIEWRALNDIEVGICDGLSYEQVRHRFPDVYRGRSADKLAYRYPRGESYLDVISRLEPVIFELERGEDEVIIISHQAVLRSLYAYFLDLPAAEIPFLDIPLNTVFCLQPMTYGCKEKRTKINAE